MRRRIIAGIGALALLGLGLGNPAKAGDCALERLDIRGAWGTARFSVEIADDPKEQ